MLEKDAWLPSLIQHIKYWCQQSPETLISPKPIHSATPDTAFSAPHPPPQSSVPCFLSFPPPSFLPSLSPPLWSSCPPPPCAPAGHPQWPPASVTSAAGATWDQPQGERGLQHRQAGAEVPGECEGGEHAASCGRGHRLLQSCRWSPRQWGGLLHCSGPLIGGSVLWEKGGGEDKERLFTAVSGHFHEIYKVSLRSR